MHYPTLRANDTALWVASGGVEGVDMRGGKAKTQVTNLKKIVPVLLGTLGKKESKGSAA